MTDLFDSPEFRNRRVRNWLLLGLLYAFFYATRYSFAAVMGPISAHFGWTDVDLGWFEFFMPLVYGLAVVFNGPLADRIGGKKAFLIGAVGVFFMSMLFGLETMLVVTPAVTSGSGHSTQVIVPAILRFGLSPMAVLVIMVATWAINGYFQSFGALAIVKVNAQWFRRNERGTFSAIFGVLIRFGLVLAFSGVPLLFKLTSLKWALLIPSLGVGVVLIANYFWMENSPKDAGFDGFDTGDGQGADDGKPASVSFVLRQVFTSRATWIIAATSMMIGMVRRSTVDSWWTKYFFQVHSGHTLAPQVTAWSIAILGILGGFAMGPASDKYFQSRRAPLITFGFAGMVVLISLLALGTRSEMSPWTAVVILSALSFFVNGSHGMIGGAASMDFGGKKAAATAAGLFDGMQYLASAFIGPLIGHTIIRHLPDGKTSTDWTNWPLVPLPFAVIGLVLIATQWNVVPRTKRAGH